MIDLYTFCWNEQPLVPFFLHHYDASWIRKIVVFDNLSDDDSVKLLQKDPRVEVRPYDTKGRFLEPTAMQVIRDACWKRSRGEAEWALICDFDEFVHHSNIKWFLKRADKDDVRVIKTCGWQMVSDKLPIWTPEEPSLVEQVSTGMHCGIYSKVSFIKVDRVRDLNSVPGLHEAYPKDMDRKPIGIRFFKSLKTLHYKMLGWDYYWKRLQTSLARVPMDMLGAGINDHLSGPAHAHRRHFDEVRARATDLFY